MTTMRMEHGVVALVHHRKLAAACRYAGRHVRLDCACGWTAEVEFPDDIADGIRYHSPGAVWLDWSGRQVGMPKGDFA